MRDNPYEIAREQRRVLSEGFASPECQSVLKDLGFSYIDIQAVNVLLNDAEIQDEEVAEYILQNLGIMKLTDTVDPVYFVYNYVLQEVENLLGKKTNYFPRGLYWSSFFPSTSKHHLATSDGYCEDYKKPILKRCEQIADKPKFLEWFIEQIQ